MGSLNSRESPAVRGYNLDNPPKPKAATKLNFRGLGGASDLILFVLDAYPQFALFYVKTTRPTKNSVNSCPMSKSNELTEPTTTKLFHSTKLGRIYLGDALGLLLRF